MRNLKKLLFIIKILMFSMLLIAILASFIAYAPMVFFICFGILFLVSLWILADEILD